MNIMDIHCNENEHDDAQLGCLLEIATGDEFDTLFSSLMVKHDDVVPLVYAQRCGFCASVEPHNQMPPSRQHETTAAHTDALQVSR